MNFQYEYEQSILACTSLGWTSLKERRAVVKARLMYKTVNQLAPLRLWDIFQLSENVNNYCLRGPSTGLFIRRPKTEFVKKVSVIERLNYGIGYRKILEVWYRMTHFVKIFLPRPLP